MCSFLDQMAALGFSHHLKNLDVGDPKFLESLEKSTNELFDTLGNNLGFVSAFEPNAKEYLGHLFCLGDSIEFEGQEQKKIERVRRIIGVAVPTFDRLYRSVVVDVLIYRSGITGFWGPSFLQSDEMNSWFKILFQNLDKASVQGSTAYARVYEQLSTLSSRLGQGGGGYPGIEVIKKYLSPSEDAMREWKESKLEYLTEQLAREDLKESDRGRMQKKIDARRWMMI